MREADEMIIDRVLHGEHNAYALLVDKYKDRVFSLVLGIVKERTVAEDLAQEVFVKAFTSLKKFRRKSGFATWLYRIAYNTSVSETRKRKIKLKPFDEQIEIAGGLEANEQQETADVQNMRQKLLKRALSELPAEDKLILMLYYFEEKTVEEISSTSGLTASNVKVRLFRIRNKLKEAIDRLGKTEMAVY